MSCTKGYYFNTYTQNFPGGVCPGPLADHGPPKVNLWTRPWQGAQGAGLYPAESLSVLYHKCHCLFKLLDVLDPSGQLQDQPTSGRGRQSLNPWLRSKEFNPELAGIFEAAGWYRA